MTRKVEYLQDDRDGLRAMSVGAWGKEKHDLLAKYIDGTRFMRRSTAWQSRVYIELFCGPGRVWYRDTGPFADGSALRAWKASQRDDAAFTDIFINDLDLENVRICKKRLEDAGAPVRAFNLTAKAAAVKILKMLPARSVNLALLDPFSIGSLPFSMVESFARLRTMDVVVNYSVLDVQRNLQKNIRGESSDLDLFCPGWRDAIQGIASDKRAQRGRVLERWLSLVKATGAEYSKEMPLVRQGSRRAPLYYLVFAAHHNGPIRIWSDIAKGRTSDLFDGS